MEREIHTLIIWSEARTKKTEIEIYILEKFQIIKEFVCNWKVESFEKNLMSFYAHSQKERSFNEFKAIVENKMKHCGAGEFYLYVLEDKNPIYDYRKTSNGDRKINTNIFDLKTQLRAITDGGHKIHASDTTFESNKDLTILLGKNTTDFLNSEESLNPKGILTKDCVGTNGFDSLAQLFYLLNNSIDYVVLRNFECLLESDWKSKVNDIDCLVEHLNYVRYLTHATPIFPDREYCGQFTIPVNEIKAVFDFNFIGDNYFDINWQNAVLKEHEVFDGLIKVPNDTHHFYALLYHAYVQKVKVKDAYFPILEGLGKKIGVPYHRDMNAPQVKEILDEFFNLHHYQYTIPNDPVALFNHTFLNENDNTINYGERISSMVLRHNQEMFYSEVFFNSTEKKIFKLCSSYIGNNENKFLTLLEKHNIAPRVVSFSDEGVNSIVEIEYIEGIGLHQLTKESKFWRKKNVKRLIKDALNILRVLEESNIEHRDIKPNNLILVKEKSHFKLKIIDFGWSKLSSDENSVTPEMLNQKFRKKNGEHADIYSMQQALKYIFEGFYSIQKYIDNLFSKEDFNSINTALQQTNYKLSPIEMVKWELRKRPKIDKIAHKLYAKIIK